MIFYLDGKFVDADDAKVSVLDHGYLYGDGVFEGIKAYNGRILCLDEHVDRFFDSAKFMQLPMPINKSEMKDAIIQTVRRNNFRDAYLRPVLSRGKDNGGLSLNPQNCPRPTLTIIVEPEPSTVGDISAAVLGKKGIKVISTTLRRNRPDILNPKAKTTNYLNNILGKLQANAVGAQDALFLNDQGEVCELTGDNLFTIKNSVVSTPPISCGILDGITRRLTLRIAKEMGLETREDPMTLHDVYTSDECFCTATRIELVPIVWVDGRQIGEGKPGPMTLGIIKRFLKIANSEGAPVFV